MNDYCKDPYLYMVIQIETGLASYMNFLRHGTKYYQYIEESWKPLYTQGDPGGNINSFGGESAGHCVENNGYNSEWLPIQNYLNLQI